MPTSFVFTNKQDTEDYWALRLDLCDQRVLLRHAEKMRAIKRTNCSSFDTRSLFAKFERGLAPPCMPTTTILSFKTEKECSPVVDVVTIDLNGYSLKKKISKIHVTVVEEGLPGMDGSLYISSRPRPSNLTFKNLWGLKRTKRRLRQTRPAFSQQRPVNSRSRLCVTAQTSSLRLRSTTTAPIHSSITKMQTLSKLHGAAMDGALYEAWGTDSVTAIQR